MRGETVRPDRPFASGVRFGRRFARSDGPASAETTQMNLLRMSVVPRNWLSSAQRGYSLEAHSPFARTATLWEGEQVNRTEYEAIMQRRAKRLGVPCKPPARTVEPPVATPRPVARRSIPTVRLPTSAPMPPPRPAQLAAPRPTPTPGICFVEGCTAKVNGRSGDPICKACAKKTFEPGQSLTMQDGTKRYFTPSCDSDTCGWPGRHTYTFWFGRGRCKRYYLCRDCEKLVNAGQAVSLHDGTVIARGEEELDGYLKQESVN